MKKISVICLTLFIILTALNAQAQGIKNAPQRNGMYLYSNQHSLEIAKDVEIKKWYPNGMSTQYVVVKIMNKGVTLKVFLCTKEEYEFLKNQLKGNIQIVFDDDIFIGFTKIIIY